MHLSHSTFWHLSRGNSASVFLKWTRVGIFVLPFGWVRFCLSQGMRTDHSSWSRALQRLLSCLRRSSTVGKSALWEHLFCWKAPYKKRSLFKCGRLLLTGNKRVGFQFTFCVLHQILILDILGTSTPNKCWGSSNPRKVFFKDLYFIFNFWLWLPTFYYTNICTFFSLHFKDRLVTLVLMQDWYQPISKCHT